VTTKCFSVVRGKRLRLTRMDECGNPPDYATPAALVVTKGFIRVALSAETADGEDIEVRNADGDLCINDRSADQFKRWNIETELCAVDPAAAEIISNQRLEEDWDGNVVGVRQPEGGATHAFALELWSGIPGEDCVPGEPTAFGYLLLPFVVPGVIGDIEVQNGETTFTFSGHTRGAGGWGIGPYEVVPTDAEHTPGPLGTAMAADEHHLLRTTTVAPPDPECGALAMPEHATAPE
jgi:hypothetical protein